jgi:two-component system chemotaxis sensor kinase CheA
MNNASDIAADFILEAGEIAERLGEQLVDLEQRPTDADLLNAIFRGFHTIKGGAGFLHVVPMVDLCHVAEEVFDALRSGRRKVDAHLLDLALQALDGLQAMLGALRDGTAVPAASEPLLDALHAIRDGIAAPAAPPVIAAPAAPAGGTDAITDDEFEALLDGLHGKKSAPGAAPAGTIAEDEFEALLDALHGKGAPPGPAAPAAAPRAPQPPAVAPPAQAAATGADPARTPTKDADATVRVEVKRLDAMMNLVGELVLARNRLKTLHRRTSGARRGANDGDLDRAIAGLDLITARLQSAVMKTRMQPIGRVFSRFPKVARDVARALSKDVRLELLGEETEIDKNIVEALSDPLVHLVRNAIDHGIEAPEKRDRAGKPRQGTVRLSAQHEGDHIEIVVRDDGAGMDPEVLRAKARDKGLITPEAAARLTPDECLQLIFLPGFSTKSEVSEISGRGVGMDVVMTRLKELNGQVNIHSAPGAGSTITIRLPLTLAILTTLVVTAGGRPYALPLGAVDEVFRFRRDAVLWVDGREVLDVRGQTLPLLFLRRWLSIGGDSTDGCVVVLRSGELRYGLVVDVVRGRDEVVVKPLPPRMRDLAGFAGATITGDGAIALILDAHGLYRAG